MKKLIVTISLIFIFLKASGQSQVPPFRWVQQAGGSGSISGKGIALDGTGNIYLTGEINGIASFESITLSGYFLAKYNPLGQLLWATNAGGTGVATDSTGNVYAVSSNNRLSKFDGTGHQLWTRTNPVYYASSSLAVSAAGDCFVIGEHSDFGANSQLSISRYSSSGTLHWFKQAVGGYIYGKGIAVDATGNLFVVGLFGGSATFGNPFAQITLYNKGINDAFFAKYDSAGRIIWVTSFGSTNGATRADGVVVMADGSSCIVGTMDNPSSGFVAKYSSSSTLMWMRFLTNAQPLAIAADAANDVYVAGAFKSQNGPAYFGNTNLVSAGNNDIFLAKYDASGTLQWVTGFGGLGDDTGYGIASTSSGGIYLTGSFQALVPFGAFTLTSGAASDVFLAHLADSDSGSSPPPNLSLGLYPGLKIDGLVNRLYRVEFTDALQTNWQTLTNLTLPYSPYTWIDTSSASKRFYRAVLVGP